MFSFPGAKWEKGGNREGERIATRDLQVICINECLSLATAISLRKSCSCSEVGSKEACVLFSLVLSDFYDWRVVRLFVGGER